MVDNLHLPYRPPKDEDQHKANLRAVEDWARGTKEAVESAAQAAYPVGSIFISTVSTNPGTLLGFGTWAAFATGRTLVGIDAGQTEFDTVEETGGAKTHTLVEAEMPAHTHTQSPGGLTNFAPVASSGVGGTSNSSPTGSTGGGGAHNNLQPYVVVYMWKRTA